MTPVITNTVVIQSRMYSLYYHQNLVLINQRKLVLRNSKIDGADLTPSGTINLNLNLLKAPSDIIDYIILHELCNLKIKEHSHHFWDLLHKFMPDYQEKIDWLNTNGNNLI